MRGSRAPDLLLPFGVVLAVWAGCQPAWRRAAAELDIIAKHVEEFGTVTASEPLLIENKGQFAIKYDRDVKDYIDAARTGVQGRARVSRETALDVQTAIDVRVGLDGLLSGLATARPAQSGVLESLRQQLVQAALSATTMNSIYGQIPNLVDVTKLAPSQKATYDLIGTVLARAAGGNAADGGNNGSTVSGDEAAAAPPAADAPKSVEGGGPDTDSAKSSEPTSEVQPTPPAFVAELPTTRPAKAVLSSAQFTPPLTLTDTVDVKLSERQALLVGVNDKATENMLKYLLDPGVGVLGDKRIVLGILQINCQPGWRTREGYIADVMVSAAYARRKPGQTSNGSIVAGEDKQGSSDPGEFESSRSAVGRYYPNVVSVFPSLEAQILDLRLSVREQVALATRIAGALQFLGSAASAQAMTDYVNRLETDLATRNAIPLITSYSNGTNCGFRIQPALQALAEPAAGEARSAEILHAAAFPALVLFVIDEDERKNQTPDIADDWTHLEVMISSRWIPARGGWLRERWSENERLGIANRIDHVRKLLVEVATDPELRIGNSSPVQSNTANELLRRFKLYENVAIGLTRFGALGLDLAKAKPADAAISQIEPRRGFRDAPTVLAIQGDGFAFEGSSLIKQVTVGGVACPFEVVGPKTIVAVVLADAFPEPDEPQEVCVVSKKNVAIASAPLRPKFDRSAPDVPAPPSPRISVKRDEKTGKVTEITISSEALDTGHDKALLEAIRAILEREHCCTSVKVTVDSSSSIQNSESD